MNKKNSELILVYNTDAELKSAVGDFVTRLIAPDKYPCNLCMVTYGGPLPVFKKQSWKEFLHTLPYKKVFLQRDRFLKKYEGYQNITLPVILIGFEKELRTLVSAEEINRVKDLEELKKIITDKLSNEEK